MWQGCPGNQEKNQTTIHWGFEDSAATKEFAHYTLAFCRSKIVGGRLHLCQTYKLSYNSEQ